MIRTPGAGKTKVAIAERTGKRDLADIRRGTERRRGGFERRESARDLSSLEIDPFRFMPLGRPPASLVNQQDRRIHDAVGQRLQAQGGKTCARLSWNDAATAGAVIEIFQDNAESNRTVPSSNTNAGILPSGFCCRTLSAGFMVSAGSILISPSRPSTLAPILILRTKGEDGE